MLKIFTVIFNFFLSLFSISHDASVVRLVGNLSATKPAFVTPIPNALNSSLYHLAISSFNGAPFSSDYVFYYSNFSLDFLPPKQLNNAKLVWPNEVTYINETIFNADTDPYGGLIAAGGFLVPSKTDGGVYYYPFTSKDRVNITDRPPIILTSMQQKWFYHRVRYIDVSGDGQKDILTCRANKPIIGQTTLQMVALVFDKQKSAFNEHIISNDACDIFFDIADIDNDGRFEIIASGFFIEKLNLIYSNHPNNSFINGDVTVKTLDTTSGHLFDVKIYDLDKQGNKELLITNHQGNKDKPKGAMYYFTLKGNVRDGEWTRVVVYDNFPVLKTGINQAAPGGAQIFYPRSNETSGRPHIVVAGDGSENAYIFKPSETNPLSYELVWQQLFNGYTVGGIGIADIDNDNYTELLIPAYEANKVYIYTCAP